ncbi:MAG: DUF3857 and transglutaminase domain-containing protein [Gallionella sp.]|nr:DUF3857 and transglutaminase domain-containing protein [Gallionella sp.]
MRMILTLWLLLATPAFAANGYFPDITILKDHWLVVVRSDATRDQTFEMLFQLNTDNALSRFGTQSIAFNSDSATLKVLEAYTLTPAGQRINLEKNAIRIQSDPVSDGATKFSDTKNVVMVFPRLERGSKLYYRVKLHTFKNTYPGYFSTHNTYPPTYRREDAKIELRTAPNIKAQVDAPGMSGGQQPDMNGMKRWVYRYRNDKAQPYESAQVAYSDFSPGFYASNYGSWGTLAKLYDQKATAAAKITPKVKALAEELTLGIGDRAAQIKTLHHWVSRNIRYVAVDLGNGGIVPHSADSILDNHYGDCKDHATLLQALLAAKGIPSSQVIIGSNYAYVLPKVPGIFIFNHIINYIPELNLYLDTTASMVPFGALPDYEYDKPVLLTALAKQDRTPVAKVQDHKVIVNATMQMLPDGKIKGTASITGSGYKEGRLRSDYQYYSTDSLEDSVNAILQENGETGVGEFKTTDPLDLAIPFSVNSEFVLDAPANVPGPSGITIPRGIVPGNLYALSQYKLLEERHFPRVCTSREVEENITLSFPQGISVESIPPNTEIIRAGITYRATYTLTNNTISIHRSFERQNERGFCDTAIQEADKQLLEEIKRDLRAQIVYR